MIVEKYRVEVGSFVTRFVVRHFPELLEMH